MTEEEKAEVLGRIKATDSAADLEGCDLVIEAVFEDSDLKAKVTAEAEPKLVKTASLLPTPRPSPLPSWLRLLTSQKTSSGCTFSHPSTK